MLSIPKLAEKFKIPESRLRNELEKQNYIARVENEWTLMDKGIRAGGQPFNYYGTYIKFPENFQIDIGSSREIRSIKISLPEPLRKAIINNIRDPIFNRTGTRGWRQHVTAKIQNNNFNIETQKFHRTRIVERGQADFTRSNLGLNTDELALLYSYYYFQMHFSSTVALFYDLRKIILEKIINTSNKIYFVDIGCGPFTSGIAFLYFTRLSSMKRAVELRRNSIDLQYRGIDISKSMLSLGKKLCTDYSSEIEDNGLYYSRISVSKSVNRVTRSIRNSGNNSAIILNCCYLFASPSLDVEDLSHRIIDLIENNPDSKIIFIYQNAPTNRESVTNNYHDFINRTSDMIKEQTDVKELRFSFKNALNNQTLDKKVRYNLIWYN